MPQLAEPVAIVEQFDCPTCSAPAGSTCRTRGGKVVPQIAQKLVITSGKNKGEHPSVATVYRILAESKDVGPTS